MPGAIRQHRVLVQLTVEARGQGEAIAAASRFFSQAGARYLFDEGGLVEYKVLPASMADLGPAEVLGIRELPLTTSD